MAARASTNGPLRVLVWSELFWPYIGGAEILTARLMLELRERGYEFLVVTSHDNLELPDEAHYGEIPVHRIQVRAAFGDHDLSALGEARQQLAEVKRAFAPQVLHVNVCGPSLLIHLQTADVHPVPSLIALHNEVMASQTAGPGSLLHQAMQTATWVTACSETVLGQARQVAPQITARSSAVLHGVDLGTEPSSPPTPPSLLCLGRLMPQKGLDLALEAFARLVDRFPALRLRIAGDGVARAGLERQAADLGLASTVDFLGWVDPDRVHDLIEEATIVLLPSRREGLSMVAVQAASRERPIVGCRAGGLPEVVVHMQNGILVEREDADGLAKAIAYLLERPEEVVRMGRAGRAMVRETLSLDRYVDDHDNLYRMLAGRDN